MKPKQAVSAALKIWKTHFGDCVDYAVITACVMLMPIAPLLFLSKSALAPAALMAVPLFLFLVLPMRMNAGSVLRHVVAGADSMNSSALIFGDSYRRSLGKGLKMALLLLLWSLPGIALSVYAWHMYKGAADAFTIINFILDLGGRNISRGLTCILLIYAASWLPLLAGMMLHSGARFCEGTAKVLKGHRGGLCLTWLCSLLPLLPFFIAEIVILKCGMAPVIASLMSMQLDGLGRLFVPMVWQSLIAFVLLLLPAVPLRQLMLASYVAGIDGGRA